MILALIAVVILASLRYWASGAILSTIHAPYGVFVLHLVGVSFFVACVLLIDRVVRALYWNGYLRRRRNRDTPALVEDTVTVALVILGLSVGLSVEEGLSVTSLVTASGATAIILGIALQAVIQDLFSGLSINLDGSYALGDWLTVYSEELDMPLYGRVTGITWRTTFLTLEDGRRLMVPNHMMTNNPVLNHSRPYEPKRIEVEISVDNRVPAERIDDKLLGEAFKVVRQPGFAREPEPDVVVEKLTEDGIYFRVRFYIYPDRLSPSVAKSLMLRALLLVVQRNDIASPVQQVELMQPPQLDAMIGTKEAIAALSRAPLFARVLDEEQIAGLANRSQTYELPRGSVLMTQGDPPSSMYIILEGAVSVSIRGADGEDHEVAVSSTGDVVGEMSLMTGAPRTATVVALSGLRLLEITKDSMEVLLRDAPGLVERFSNILSQRQLELDTLAKRHSRKERIQRDILTRMKEFFSGALG